MKDNELPIGYWLKTVDKLLKEGIDEIQSSFEFSRTDWQLLNLVAKHSEISINEAKKIMNPFLTTTDFDICANKLSGRQLILVSEGKIKITETGVKQHKQCLEKQLMFRKKAMQDVSAESYKTTIKTLQQMSENLGYNKEP